MAMRELLSIPHPYLSPIFAEDRNLLDHVEWALQVLIGSHRVPMMGGEMKWVWYPR